MAAKDYDGFMTVDALYHAIIQQLVWANESQVISLSYIMWLDNLAFCYGFFSANFAVIFIDY